MMTTKLYTFVSLLILSLVTASRHAVLTTRRERSVVVGTPHVPERKLNGAVVPLSTFCNETSDLEISLAGILVDFFSDFATAVYVDDDPFVCLCIDTVPGSPQQTLTLECRARYLFTSDDPTANPIVVVETMTLVKNDTMTGIYVPTTVSWRETTGVSLEESGSTLGESYTVSLDEATGALFLETCTIADEVCADAICGVCEGGITSFRQDPTCFNTTCDEGRTNVGIFSYYQSTGIVVQNDIPVDAEGCSTEGPFVEDFCAAENLRSVAQDMTDSYVRSMEPTLRTNVTRGYECRCIDDVLPLSITCDLLYVFVDDPVPVEYANTETLMYATDGSYQVATTMRWCDTGISPANGAPLYCEIFTLDFLQQNYATCTLDGCQAPFCSLCPDGVSLAFSCGSVGVTCESNYTGSFWESNRVDKLAIQKCADPVSPTQTPMEASSPTTAPNTGMPATPRGPTTSNAIRSGLGSLCLPIFVFLVCFTW